MKNNGLTQGFQYFYKNAEIWKKKRGDMGKYVKFQKRGDMGK
jgi:hypothetical protein